VAFVDMAHFDALRDKANRQLAVSGGKYGREQIEQFPWFYGALGAVPSEVVFICENPSLAGVRLGLTQTTPPDIESQWGGGEIDNPAKRFRPALVEAGLKDPLAQAKGGWRCYLTNVVKQANIVNEQNARTWREKVAEARTWADVLRWELQKVAPNHIFCVGGNSTKLVTLLQVERQLPPFRVNELMHYSARRSDDDVRRAIRDGILAVIGR
jgi:Uracil DNA glycosylase superfamily